MEELIEIFENEGIYEEPDPIKLFNLFGKGVTKLAKYCILSKKYPQLLDEIREIKDDLDRQYRYDMTTLMWTSIYDLKDATKILIENGANLDLQDCWGRTALMYACCHGHEEIVKSLVLARANIDITNYNGYTTIDLAKNDTIKEILEQGPIMAKSAII